MDSTSSSEHEDTAYNPTSTATHNGLDLEKQDTAQDVTHNNVVRPRLTRTQSLARRSTRGRFQHPLTHIKTTEAEIVDFDGPDDPYRPLNWPFRKKVITTLLYGLTTMGSTWSSSIYSPAVDIIASEYDIGAEVSLLGLSFLLLGFGLGPLLWAPLSEVYVYFEI